MAAYPRMARLIHEVVHEHCSDRWVGTGGGGYQFADIVPRIWTIHFAEMCAAADTIPEQWLEDRPPARFPAAIGTSSNVRSPKCSMQRSPPCTSWQRLMVNVHRFVAYAIPTFFALLALWSLVSFIRNKSPGDFFWNVVAAAQVILGIQILIGGILYLFTDGRPQSNGPEWLHYVYGGLFPLAVLVVAHRVSKKNESLAWVVFGFGALVIFGLTFRALQTGLGVD